MVIGMSLAYLASGLGMALAGWSWHRRRRRGDTPTRERPQGRRHTDAKSMLPSSPGDDESKDARR